MTYEKPRIDGRRELKALLDKTVSPGPDRADI